MLNSFPITSNYSKMTDSNPTESAHMNEIFRLRKVCANLRCDNEELIHHVFWFIYNWPNDFIACVWGNNPMLHQHLNDKFDGFYSKAPNPHSALLQFYFDLDATNRNLLIDYIMRLPKQS